MLQGAYHDQFFLLIVRSGAWARFETIRPPTTYRREPR
jgi:hypothetical protein